MATKEDLQQFTLDLNDALEAGNFPGGGPPGDITLEDRLIQIRPVVSGEWEDALEAEPPLIQQEAGEDLDQFLVDYLDALASLLKGDVRQQIDLDSAIEEAGGVTVPPPETDEPDETGGVQLPDIPAPWDEIRSMALDQSLPKEDREHRIGERLESRLVDAYPESFTNLAVGIKFPQVQSGENLADVVKIEFGGVPSSAGKERFIIPGALGFLSAVGSVKRPDRVWENFMAVLEMFDTEGDEFRGIHGKLETVANTSAFRIEEGLADFDEMFFLPDEIGEIVQRNPELWLGGVLGEMKGVSKAWWAAQRVLECAEGVQQTCDLIEREISGNVRRGWDEWYLKEAFTQYLEGDFDPVRFTKNWHAVFQPGESEAEARRRRGEVDLEALRGAGNGETAQIKETDDTPPEPPEEPTEPEETGGTPPEPPSEEPAGEPEEGPDAEPDDEQDDEAEPLPEDADEAERLTATINREDATQIGDWLLQDDVGEVIRGTNDAVLVEWEDTGGRIRVTVERSESEATGVSYSVFAEPIADNLRLSDTGTKTVRTRIDAVDEAVREAVRWLRRHQADTPLPEFTIRVEGGILKPLLDITNRLGGGLALLRVDATAVELRSAAFNTAVEFDLTDTDAEQFTVTQPGEVTVDVGDLWDAVKRKNFGDMLSLGLDPSGERPQVKLSGRGTAALHAAAYTVRDLPTFDSPTFQFTANGQDWKRAVRAVKTLSDDVTAQVQGTALGVREGEAVLAQQTEQESVAVNLFATAVSGDGLVSVPFDPLDNIRIAMPRPSQTDITITGEFEKPLLAEYQVGKSDVDLRVALAQTAVPASISPPPRSISPDELLDGNGGPNTRGDTATGDSGAGEESDDEPSVAELADEIRDRL